MPEEIIALQDLTVFLIYVALLLIQLGFNWWTISHKANEMAANQKKLDVHRRKIEKCEELHKSLTVEKERYTQYLMCATLHLPLNDLFPLNTGEPDKLRGLYFLKELDEGGLWKSHMAVRAKVTKAAQDFHERHINEGHLSGAPVSYLHELEDTQMQLSSDFRNSIDKLQDALNDIMANLLKEQADM